MKFKIIIVLFFIFILFLIRVFLFEIYTINQNSMNNTYYQGDKVLILKNFYSIKQNDVIVFKREDEALIKRCVGLPGDVITILDGKIYLNDNLIPQSSNVLLGTKSNNDIFTQSDIFYNFGRDWTVDNMGEYKIPKKGMTIKLSSERKSLYQNLFKGELQNSEKKISITDYTFRNDYYFLVGDNRINSVDSRIFGPISSSAITGKVILNLKF